MNIFEYDQPELFFRAYSEKKLKANPRLSYRGIARRIGVSNSTLNDFLNGKRIPNYQNMYSIINWMDLDPADEDYFKVLIDLQCFTEDSLIEATLEKKQALLEAKSYRLLLRKLLGNAKKEYSFQYSNQDSNGFRVLTHFRNQFEPHRPIFSDHFISTERGLAATAYFVPNKGCHTYSLLLDKAFNGKYPMPTPISTENRNVLVEFDAEKVRVKNGYFAILGQKSTVKGCLEFSKERAEFAGRLTSENQKINPNINILFGRVS